MKRIRRSGLFDIVIAGLSGSIGFEIFVLLNYAYFNLSGPYLVFALLLGGGINFLIMLSYCELSAAMPLVGGEYTYIKTAYGGYIGFIAGCFRWLASIFAASLAAVTFVLQLAFLLSIFSPQLQATVVNWAWLLSILIIVVMSAFEIRGSQKVGSIVVIAFIALFAVFIIGGFVQGVNPSGMFDFPSPQGLPGVLAAVVYTFPMFIGTKSLIATATTAENPEKNVPRGLILSALFVIPLYVLLAVVAMSTVAASGTTEQVSLLNFAADSIFGGYGGIVFALAGMVACLSALGTSLSVQSSISRGMSRDGYFPKLLTAVHSRFGTHYIAVIVGSVFIMGLSTLGDVPFLGYAASFGSLIVFALVNLSLIKLRKTKPHMDRPFKTPLFPIIPILGFILSVFLLVFPVFFGDGNATDALTSGAGIIAIVLGSYYLRMAGRFRLQIAVGGIGMGVGIVLGLLSVMNIAGLVGSIIPFIPNYAQALFGVVLIVTGYFNLKAGSQKKQEEQKESRVSKLVEALSKKFKFAF
ncbi:MAG: APC family permease [Candidatus Bathyarchaeota archaeon]|nr:APC family permease [Candidatus Bathyarchaeota archaeon]